MRIHLFILALVLISHNIKAQLEKIIVETYYIADNNDGTDTDGGKLTPGTYTYRIYIDMLPGYKLTKIYGDANHPLIISSTDHFFNNTDRGQTFGYKMSKTDLGKNTVALDTWLSLGQITKSSTQKTWFGCLKNADKDGSMVGGANNDGGSNSTPGGLLTNNSTQMGIPLTTADGFDTLVTLPTNWSSYGILSANGDDSTLFGSLVNKKQFISYNAGLSNSGVRGLNPDSNQVLVAQLSTLGKLSFELNIEIKESTGNNPKTFKYVADTKNLQADELPGPSLKYPPLCGCKDPGYLEYSTTFACSAPDSCKTPIVIGCTDTLACNYNPDANFNIPLLCCYPGYCNDRDLSIVCPALSNKKKSKTSFKLFPNPAQNEISLQLNNDANQTLEYEIRNSLGLMVLSNNLGTVSNNVYLLIDISHLPPGVYHILVNIDGRLETKTFIK